MERRVNYMENALTQVDKRSPDTEKSLEALEKFSLPIVEHLIRSLDDEDKWVRYLAAEALGNLGDLRSVVHLDQLRSDKDPDLRFISGQSLSKIVTVKEILTDSRRMGCDTCLIRYIAEEVLVQRKQNRVSIKTPDEPVRKKLTAEIN
jgi:HEAT repeat protein